MTMQDSQPLRNPERVERMRPLIEGIQFADAVRQAMPSNVTAIKGHVQMFDQFEQLAREATAEL